MDSNIKELISAFKEIKENIPESKDGVQTIQHGYQNEVWCRMYKHRGSYKITIGFNEDEATYVSVFHYDLTGGIFRELAEITDSHRTISDYVSYAKFISNFLKKMKETRNKDKEYQQPA